jgi:FtsH-binding integral membrane protein
MAVVSICSRSTCSKICQPPQTAMTKMFWLGLGIVIAGVAPLLAVATFSHDPHPNPIGPCLLAFVTFWPGIILMVAGFFRSR